MKIEKIGIVANVRKKEIKEVLANIIETIPVSVAVVGYTETAALISGSRVVESDTLTDCDAVLALGGDGTLLAAARIVEKDEIPLLGIKFRSLGFLTEDDPVRAVEDLFEGRYMIQERMRLEVSPECDSSDISGYSALNDAVIHGIGVSRVIHLKTMVNGIMVGEYLSDGVIVSTPTGSTAYSLAAGGPIVDPTSVEAFIINPLCPHSLSVRPVVVSSEETFTIETVDGNATMLTIDGQQACEIKGGVPLTFRRSSKVTKLIVSENYSFYDLVRRKLNWGGVLKKG